MSPLSVIVPLGVSVSVPLSVTALREMSAPVTVRLVSAVVPAHSTLKVHIATAGIQCQRLRAVDGRGERDVAVGAVIVLVAVHRCVDRKVHRTGERDGPHRRSRRSPHSGRCWYPSMSMLPVVLTVLTSILPAVHRQARQLGRAAHHTLKIHVTVGGTAGGAVASASSVSVYPTVPTVTSR